MSNPIQELFHEAITNLSNSSTTSTVGPAAEFARFIAGQQEQANVTPEPMPAVDRSQGMGAGQPISDPSSEFRAFFDSALKRQ